MNHHLFVLFFLLLKLNLFQYFRFFWHQLHTHCYTKYLYFKSWSHKVFRFGSSVVRIISENNMLQPSTCCFQFSNELSLNFQRTALLLYFIFQTVQLHFIVKIICPHSIFFLMYPAKKIYIEYFCVIQIYLYLYYMI